MTRDEALKLKVGDKVKLLAQDHCSDWTNLQIWNVNGAHEGDEFEITQISVHPKNNSYPEMFRNYSALTYVDLYFNFPNASFQGYDAGSFATANFIKVKINY